jgi:mannose-6-phosphate isomerase-like protein (cupin superfamily)
MKVLSGGCTVFAPGDGQVSTLGNCTAQAVINRTSGTRQITQTVCVYGIGCSPAIVNPVAEEALYVAHGEGTCYVDGFSYDLRPGTGVYIPPEAEYSIENSVPERLLMVSACCPEDRGRHVVEKPRAAAPGEAPRRTVNEQDRQVVRAGKDREFRYLVHTDLGCQQLTQFVGWIPPSKSPFHFHEYEEGIFILEGCGMVHVEGESGTGPERLSLRAETSLSPPATGSVVPLKVLRTCEFGPRSSIYFPKGVRHCVENPGTAPIRLLGVFYPSGSPSAAYED